jgi:hypothetical protein
MAVMKVIGRTYGHIMNLFTASPLPQLFAMSVKTFKLRKKTSVREIAVKDTDRITWVESRLKTVPGRFDGRQVSWGDKASHSKQREIFHTEKRELVVRSFLDST